MTDLYRDTKIGFALSLAQERLKEMISEEEHSIYRSESQIDMYKKNIDVFQQLLDELEEKYSK